jgi:hypothetical protein
MPRPIRLQRSRARGSRLRADNGLPIVSVSRPGPWGNPFSSTLAAARSKDDKKRLRARSVAAFERALLGRSQRLPFSIADVRQELRGKNLACWCPLDEPCHADVLLRVANGGLRVKARRQVKKAARKKPAVRRRA